MAAITKRLVRLLGGPLLSNELDIFACLIIVPLLLVSNKVVPFAITLPFFTICTTVSVLFSRERFSESSEFILVSKEENDSLLIRFCCRILTPFSFDACCCCGCWTCTVLFADELFVELFVVKLVDDPLLLTIRLLLRVRLGCALPLLLLLLFFNWPAHFNSSSARTDL